MEDPTSSQNNPQNQPHEINLENLNTYSPMPSNPPTPPNDGFPPMPETGVGQPLMNQNPPENQISNAPASSPMKKIIMIVVILLILAGGGYATWKFLFADTATEPENTAENEAPPGINLNLGEDVTNSDVSNSSESSEDSPQAVEGITETSSGDSENPPSLTIETEANSATESEGTGKISPKKVLR